MSSLENQKLQILQQDSKKKSLMKKYIKKNDKAYTMLLLKYIKLDLDDFEMVCGFDDADWIGYDRVVEYEEVFNNMSKEAFSKVKKNHKFDFPYTLYCKMREQDKEEEEDIDSSDDE